MYDDPLEKYIRGVTREMGVKQRQEVARELKSHILDGAEELATQRNVEVDDTIIKEVISKMGPAEEVAKMYPVEETLIDKIIFAVKAVGLFTFIFIVIAATMWQILKVYVKTLELTTSLIIAIAITYIILLAIYLIFRFKIPSKLHKRLHKD